MKRITESKTTNETDKISKAKDRKAGPMQPEPTLIANIEQIIELAIELKLDQTFYAKAQPYLAYVAERMSLTPSQALIFALFIEKSSDSRIQIEDFSRLINCRTVRILAMMTETNELVQRQLIRRTKRNDSIYYSVPADVINAVRENRVYVPKPIDHLTTEQLFDRIDTIFENAEEDDEALIDKLDTLISANPQLPFCQKIKSYGLNDDLTERLLFYVFCHRFINKNDDQIGTSDWEDYFPRFTVHHIASMMKARSLTLQQTGVIENRNDDGMNDSAFYHLTNKAKSELFPDLQLADQQAKKRTELIDHKTFAERKLFYNQKMQTQIAELEELLSPEHFANIQQRLTENGLRQGFACLFYGSPGTGKTETVYQLARRTGRDLMVVDVSQIKSCWVGESEKNIKATFSRYRSYVKQSERAPILLFNEADAVLGIRQEGAQHAVDKMENSIQNIILQEMEQLEGIMIATTNLTQNLDKAFERRFLYKIEFERPSIEAKSRIWSSMIPCLDRKTAASLARQYDFSGGQIENIARKRTIELILHGKEPSLEQLNDYCRAEIICDGQNQPRCRIGF